MVRTNLQVHNGAAEESDGEKDRAGAAKYTGPAVTVEEARQEDGPPGAPTWYAEQDTSVGNTIMFVI